MKRKSIRFAQPRANLRGTFSVSIVHWQMARPFTVKNLNFEQKMGYGFLFTRFTQVPAFNTKPFNNYYEFLQVYLPF